MIDHTPLVLVFVPVLLAAAFVAVSLAFMHLLFKAGLVFERDLPRPLAYAVGLGVIGITFTLLELFGRPSPVPNWIPVLDFWLLTIAGAVPTLGLRGVAANNTLKRMENLTDDAGDR